MSNRNQISNQGSIELGRSPKGEDEQEVGEGAGSLSECSRRNRSERRSTVGVSGEFLEDFLGVLLAAGTMAVMESLEIRAGPDVSETHPSLDFSR